MSINFDLKVLRRGFQSKKWDSFSSDVLPLTMADMDFQAPSQIIHAMEERLAHGIFGYVLPDKEFKEPLCERVEHLYNWHITPEQVIFVPGLVSGLNVVARAIGRPGDGVLINTPIFDPFFSAATNHNKVLHSVQLAYSRKGSEIRYEIDFDAVEATIKPTTSLFLLCNPHNPVGRVYERWELEKLAEACSKHNIVICSDEVHCDLLLGEKKHTPIATISSDVAQRTITLMSPSKTFNTPGLTFSFMIIQNPELMIKVEQAANGLIPYPNIMGAVAARAAYTMGQGWLDELIVYLKENRDSLVSYVKQYMPKIATTVPEGTYLAWLDFET